jgi:hypothetical protein
MMIIIIIPILDVGLESWWRNGYKNCDFRGITQSSETNIVLLVCLFVCLFFFFAKANSLFVFSSPPYIINHVRR